MFLIAAVIAGGGFYAGALVGKHNAGTGTGGFAAAFRNAGAGASTTGARTGRTGTGTGTGTGGFGGFGGGTGAAGGAGADTIGTIKLIDGNTVYVQTAAGTIVQVKVSNATKISISSTGTVKNLLPGQTVIVAGKTASGAVSATTITQSSGLGSFSGG
jgi:hypothetical protein